MEVVHAEPGATVVDADDVLAVRSLSKTFGGTQALRDVDLTIRAGEVHGLVGHNGSGKSTLIKVLAGFHHADPGAEAFLDDEPFDLAAAADLHHDRLRFVHQDLGLVLELSAVENLALHARRGGDRRVRRAEEERFTRELLGRFGVDLDVRRPLGEASPVERTVLAIARALRAWDGGRGVLVLDEPTAVLPGHEVDRLFQIVADVRAQGTSVLYVSHRLDEIFRICDRVTVLREGRVVATADVGTLTKSSLISLILGEERDAAPTRPAAPPQRGDAPLLEVRDLSARYLEGASLEIRRGEVVGLAGRPGSGRDELPYALAGALPYPVSGSFRTNGEDGWRSFADRDHPEAVLLPADRGSEGVVSEFSVKENLTLSVLRELGRRGILSRARETGFARSWLTRLEVRAETPDAPITTLSGGNQQKVLVGRCLAQEPTLLMLCEPTAGVDVGTRQALYELIAKQAAGGLTVLVSSTDADDLLALCSRIVVFQDGAPVRELSGDEISEHALVHAMEEDGEERG
jgi:ribose transport system ATP-binding protein